jgi:hypothetical protein
MNAEAVAKEFLKHASAFSTVSKASLFKAGCALRGTGEWLIASNVTLREDQSGLCEIEIRTRHGSLIIIRASAADVQIEQRLD